MRYVGTEELRKKLRDVLDDVKHHGEHYGVLRYETTEAYLVPAEWYEAARDALMKGANDGLGA